MFDRVGQTPLTKSILGRGLMPKEKTESYIAKSFTIRENQYDDIYTFAAYNKLTGKQPDNTSAVVREALDYYLLSVDDTWRNVLGNSKPDKTEKEPDAFLDNLEKLIRS